jgi:hypothetical protein
MACEAAEITHHIVDGREGLAHLEGTGSTSRMWTLLWIVSFV